MMNGGGRGGGGGESYLEGADWSGTLPRGCESVLALVLPAEAGGKCGRGRESSRPRRCALEKPNIQGWLDSGLCSKGGVCCTPSAVSPSQLPSSGVLPRQLCSPDAHLLAPTPLTAGPSSHGIPSGFLFLPTILLWVSVTAQESQKLLQSRCRVLFGAPHSMKPQSRRGEGSITFAN